MIDEIIKNCRKSKLFRNYTSELLFFSEIGGDIEITGSRIGLNKYVRSFFRSFLTLLTL